MKTIGKKMLLNALIAPVMISTTFISITLLSGKSFANAQQKVQKDIGPTWITGGFYWPIVGFLNFRFVPVSYRAFTGSLAGVGWQHLSVQ